MAHSALEVAVSLPAEFSGEVFEVVDRADVQDGRPCPFLLVFGCNAGCEGLDCHAVGLADFEMGIRLLVVGPYGDGLPWPVAGLFSQRR